MTPAFDEAWFASRTTPGVQALKAYDPGHDVTAMRMARQWLVELGSNENPYGASPAARAAILDSLHFIHRYPDPRGAGIKHALSQLHGVPPEAILLGNGSHELLMQLGQVFAGPGRDVAYSRYGFAVFSLASQAAGAIANVAAARPADDPHMALGHDVDALLAAAGPATALVFVANPNNPTGTWLPADELQRLIEGLPRQAIVVIDEAYAEMANAADYATAVPLVARHPNVVVTRTFSKAYGLAGLRCGYAVAAEGLVAVMERIRESFNVNSLALAACEAALGDREHLNWTVARNVEQRDALARALASRGVRTLPSQTNFLLAHFGARTLEIEQALLQRDVVLRPMGGYGLPEYSRVTVGSADENRRFLEALDGVLA